MTGGSGLSEREGERSGLGRLGAILGQLASRVRPSWASGLFLLFFFSAFLFFYSEFLF
jgi:hypothetical protein